MRDRFEEPFEFHVRTKDASASSRRPKDSFRVGALVLVLGVSTLCAVFWPSPPKNASPDPNAQDFASATESSQEEFASDFNIAPQGGFEESILNDVRSDLEDVSALKLADVSLIDQEETQETQSLEAAVEVVPQSSVASTVYEERSGKVQITSSSFEAQIEPKSDDLSGVSEEDKSAQFERSREERVVKEEQNRSSRSKERARTSNEAPTPGYFARAANLPGRHNSFSLRNFARAANLVDSSDAYSPRSLTNATQVVDSEAEAR